MKDYQFAILVSLVLTSPPDRSLWHIFFGGLMWVLAAVHFWRERDK